MIAVLKTSDQLTFEGIDSAISSPASADGLKLLESLDGPQIVKFGPALVRASLSARQAAAMGLLTSGTYGRPGSISLRSAALQSYTVSRLMQRLGAIGSTLFSLTWKELVTPSQRPYSLLRASALRTEDTDFSSWPTPMAGTPARNGYNEAGNNDSSRKTVALCGWPSPVANDAKGSDYAYNQGRHDSITLKLGGVAKLVDSGAMPIGSTAPMESIGQLNPAHSRWLMGYRAAWHFCGVTAMQSFQKPRRRSSKRAAKTENASLEK
jgi:hypothetical protein